MMEFILTVFKEKTTKLHKISEENSALLIFVVVARRRELDRGHGSYIHFFHLFLLVGG